MAGNEEKKEQGTKSEESGKKSKLIPRIIFAIVIIFVFVGILRSCTGEPEESVREEVAREVIYTRQGNVTTRQTTAREHTISCRDDGRSVSVPANRTSEWVMIQGGCEYTFRTADPEQQPLLEKWCVNRHTARVEQLTPSNRFESSSCRFRAVEGFSGDLTVNIESWPS